MYRCYLQYWQVFFIHIWHIQPQSFSSFLYFHVSDITSVHSPPPIPRHSSSRAELKVTWRLGRLGALSLVSVHLWCYIPDAHGNFCGHASILPSTRCTLIHTLLAFQRLNLRCTSTKELHASSLLWKTGALPLKPPTQTSVLVVYWLKRWTAES